MEQHKIVIVGSGFGGIKCALELLKNKPKNSKIVLISDNDHFEYRAALYRVVTGHSPLEVCVPLREIFEGYDIEIVRDYIIDIDIEGKNVKGESGSAYKYDNLVLALGSETVYFGIPGLKERSFGFKSINESIKLKRHLHKLFDELNNMPKEEQVNASHIVIVGGGASGTEIAGNLASYCNVVAKNHKADSSMITIDLVEAAPRLLPAMPEDISEKVKMRLHSLGVNIFLNQTVMAEDIDKLKLKGMEVKTNTVIWTAGMRPNNFYEKIKEFEKDKKGKVIVDEYLRVKGFENIFVIGDAASTEYSGMAQTASLDGQFVADFIYRQSYKKKLLSYKPQKPAYAIPVGNNWAAVLWNGIRMYGRLGWLIRRVADLRYFMSILPLNKAFLAWRSGSILSESCPDCKKAI